jgi:hypothetical protein
LGNRTPNPEPRIPVPALKISRPFLADHEKLLYLAEVARRANCRPSALLELTGMPAYLLDCTAAEAVATRERAEQETQENLIEW